MSSDRRAKGGAPFAVFFLAVVLLGGCVSARMSDRAGDRAFQEGRYSDAVAVFQKGIEQQGEEGRDVLLYLLDAGLALHAAGRFEESNQLFLRSEKIADIKDYTSLSTEAATLVTSDNLTHYKGEDFEKVLINTYLAMNFALLGDREAALVEARKVNRKLLLMITEGQRKYQQNAFARYLSAILYESDGDWNNAYVDYQQTRELLPELPGLGLDLWRMATALRMPDEAERWDSQYSLSAEEKKRTAALLRRPKKGEPPALGEIVVLYENGISPAKRPNPQFRTLPKFFPRPNPIREVRVSVDGVDRGEAVVLHDIEATAIRNLDEKYGGLVAKKVAGVVAKEVVADRIEKWTNSPLLGFLSKMTMYAVDQADVRSWNLLPRDLQLLRVPVEPGLHEVVLSPVGVGGAIPAKTVQVRPGQKVFVNFRTMP